MSDQAVEAVTPDAEIEAPAESGQGDIEATPEAGVDEIPAFDEADLLDTSELGDRPVRLTIDGEERVLPLSEVLKGYNSNAAATKRFQEASSIREQAERQLAEADQALVLARAISNNPGMTMQVLANQAGLTVEQFLNLTPAQQTAVAENTAQEPEFSDPLERALYEERQARQMLEQRMMAWEQQQERQRANEAIQGAVGHLRNQFGATDEDIRSVAQQAFEQQMGPEMFPMIYQAQQFQKLRAQSDGRQTAEAARAEEDARRRAAAARASATVSSGTGAVGTAPQQVVRPMSAEEAVIQALDQLGVT